MAELAALVDSQWFWAVLGFFLGAAAAFWLAEIFPREPKREKPTAGRLTDDEIKDLTDHINTTREILRETLDGGVSREGFHEAAALSMKLIRLAIPAPFMAGFKERVTHETFSEDFCGYLAAIGPFVREGDLGTIRHMAKAALDIVYSEEEEVPFEVSPPDAEHPRQQQQGTESGTQP